MTVYKWSTTAATNDDVDSTINWQEGQSPASVNNSARAMMAAIAKWRADMSGGTATSGTSTAYTATSNQGYTSLENGIAITLYIHETNGASPTLNLDGLGAVAIQTIATVAVGAGKLRVGSIVTFVYITIANAWIVADNPNIGFESGTKVLFRQTAAPTGWTKDTTYTNAALRVTSGTISQQATAGKEFSTLFAARTIATANLPSHTHDVVGNTGDAGGHSHFIAYVDATTTALSASNTLTRSRSAGAQSDYTLSGGATTADIGLTSTVANHSHAISFVSSATGSGTAMDFAVNFVDVIIATRD